jgi:hypothetical protein
MPTIAYYKNDVVVTADPNTNLLCFLYGALLFIGNEQGEVISKFSCFHQFNTISISHNIILLYNGNENRFALYNKDGKFITEVTDQRLIKSRAVCLVHNKGMIVLVTEDKTIHFWRMV